MFRPWENTVSLSGSELNDIPMDYVVSDCSPKDSCSSDEEENIFGGRTSEYQEISTSKKQYLCKDAQRICINVYNNIVTSEGERSAIEKTSFLTNVPISNLYRILKNGPKNRKERCDKGCVKTLDPSISKLIGSIIYESYQRNEFPTVDSIFSLLKSKRPDLKISKSTTQRWISKIGFKYQTINKRTVIMESQRIIKWRIQYLEKIKASRNSNRNIYYLDETWFDTHDTPKKGWSDGTRRCSVNVPCNKGTRLTILHCGSDSGWVQNCLNLSGKNLEDCNLDYHKNMSGERFEDWFENQLLNNIEENSIIVMDNASYHSRLIEKVPNTNSNKSEIQEFLRNHDLYFEENYTKKQLLEVLGTQSFEKKFFIDEMASKRGHEVLRLPPYFCVFNPIELIWGQLKKRIRRHNVFPKFDGLVANLVKEEINKISADDWQKKIKHVIKEENSYITSPTKFIINVDDSESDGED